MANNRIQADTKSQHILYWFESRIPAFYAAHPGLYHCSAEYAHRTTNKKLRIASRIRGLSFTDLADKPPIGCRGGKRLPFRIRRQDVDVDPTVPRISPEGDNKG